MKTICPKRLSIKLLNVNAATFFLGGILFVGCMNSFRKPPEVPPIALSVIAYPRVSSNTPPDLKLTIKNVSKKVYRCAIVDDLFWGEVIIECDDKRFALRQQGVWQINVHGFYLPKERKLRPGQELTYTLKLSEFMSIEEYAQLLMGKPMNIATNWKDEVRKCKNYKVYCVTQNGEYTSNVCLVQN